MACPCTYSPTKRSATMDFVVTAKFSETQDEQKALEDMLNIIIEIHNSGSIGEKFVKDVIILGEWSYVSRAICSEQQIACNISRAFHLLQAFSQLLIGWACIDDWCKGLEFWRVRDCLAISSLFSSNNQNNHSGRAPEWSGPLTWESKSRSAFFSHE